MLSSVQQDEKVQTGILGFLPYQSSTQAALSDLSNWRREGY